MCVLRDDICGLVSQQLLVVRRHDDARKLAHYCMTLFVMLPSCIKVCGVCNAWQIERLSLFSCFTCPIQKLSPF